MDDKRIIGKAEKVSFPELGLEGVYARVDTGAKTSSVWASEVTLADEILRVVFFGETSPLYTGETVQFDDYDHTVVSTSTGHVQRRYKVKLLVKVRGKKVRAWFTLADRSTQVYPVLIGRNVLSGKFVVDVKKGRVLKDEEQQRTQSLRTAIDSAEEEV
jgi:hypothetical protein